MARSTAPSTPAADASERSFAPTACRRHANILATQACGRCAGPICSACARSDIHVFCTDCRKQRDLKTSAVDFAWLRALFVDGFVQSIAAVRARVPALLAMFVVAAGLVVLWVTELHGAGHAGLSNTAWHDIATTASGYIFAIVILGAGIVLQPLLSIPIVAEKRSALVVAGVGLAAWAPFILLYAIVQPDLMHGQFEGPLVSPSMTTCLALVLVPTISTGQALYLLRASPRALWTKSKPALLAVALALLFPCVAVVFTLMVFVCGIIVVAVAPGVGSAIFVVVAIATALLEIVSTSALASATARFLDDALRL